MIKNLAKSVLSPNLTLVSDEDVDGHCNSMGSGTSKGLQAENICITSADTTLIDLSLSIAPGEVLTIMGPSGSGKSTLLAYLGGFLARDFKGSGEILLDGRNVTQLPAEQRNIGILFQDALLFPHMSVGENLSFGLKSPLKGAARKERVQQALGNINMPDFYDRDPATLSGGQKARVALARILLSKPCALLLDEPFSKLDAELRQQMRQWVFGKARARALPTLLVTHDEADAQAAGGRVIHIGQA